MWDEVKCQYCGKLLVKDCKCFAVEPSGIYLDDPPEPLVFLPTVLFKRLHDETRLPTKAHPSDACYDLYAYVDNYYGNILIPRRQTAIIPCGFAMKLPKGWEAQIRPRSGLSLEGLEIVNAPGTVDLDYKGEIKVICYCPYKSIRINAGDKIAQGVFAKVIRPEGIKINGVERGEGGFGSTDNSKEGTPKAKPKIETPPIRRKK